MKKVKWMAVMICLFVSAACQNDPLDDISTPEPEAKKVLTDTDFKSGADGWTADFTDYTNEDGFDFKSGIQNLPAPLDSTKKAFMVSSHNRSDDLFTFIRKKVSGLKPNTEYKLLFELELASDAADNSVGIGGSPGGSVYLKAGASAREPAKIKEGNAFRFNLDKGNQATGGKEVVLLGNIGAGIDIAQYTLIKRDNKETAIAARTNDAGELWLVIGTDSGFEGETTIYYNRIKVTTL